MPAQVEITERYWTACWKWIFPYPCRKTRTLKKWMYELSYLFVSERIFYENYRGCEFNVEYKWTDWHWWPSQIHDWVFYFVTKYYNTPRPATGSCIPSGQNDDIILMNAPLARFIDERIKRRMAGNKPAGGE